MGRSTFAPIYRSFAPQYICANKFSECAKNKFICLRQFTLNFFTDDFMHNVFMIDCYSYKLTLLLFLGLGPVG